MGWTTSHQHGGPFDPEAFDLAETNRRLWFLAPRKARIAEVEDQLKPKSRLDLH